jgi:hypothetical protein
MMMNSRRKNPCFNRDSNPRSQGPSDQGLRLRARGHWDRQNCLRYLLLPLPPPHMALQSTLEPSLPVD